MDSKSPKQQLAEFLSTKPSWMQRLLQLDYDLTKEERFAWSQSDWTKEFYEVEDEYLKLLKECPVEWNAHCKRRKDQALRDVPSGRPGRPAKDGLAQEAIALKKHFSYAKVAKQ